MTLVTTLCPCVTWSMRSTPKYIPSPLSLNSFTTPSPILYQSLSTSLSLLLHSFTTSSQLLYNSTTSLVISNLPSTLPHLPLGTPSQPRRHSRTSPLPLPPPPHNRHSDTTPLATPTQAPLHSHTTPSVPHRAEISTQLE